MAVCLCVVCLLVTFARPAKMAEQVEMPFGGLTRVGPRNHVVDADPIPRREGAIFAGCMPHRKALGGFTAMYAIMAEPIEMPFGG